MTGFLHSSRFYFSLCKGFQWAKSFPGREGRRKSIRRGPLPGGEEQLPAAAAPRRWCARRRARGCPGGAVRGAQHDGPCLHTGGGTAGRHPQLLSPLAASPGGSSGPLGVRGPGG